MRKVNKDFNAPPEALQRGFQEHKINLLEKKSNHQFDGRIYNNAVKSKLKKLYHDKCAYCESSMSDDIFTVEHYRPKKGSYSYYWLGYEWSNLLPVCKKCNHAKGGKFPIDIPERILPGSSQKSRVKTPKLLANGDLDIEAMKADHSYLLDEKPYLLHPEIDEPKVFLGVERTGKLVPQSEEADKYRYEKANQTINLTHLNRDTLILNRRKIIENFEYLIKKQTLYLLKHLKENNQCDMYSVAFFGIFEWIENQSKDDQEYTFTSWYIWKNIKEKLFKIICPGNHEIEQLLTHAFDLYIASGIQDE